MAHRAEASRLGIKSAEAPDADACNRFPSLIAERQNAIDLAFKSVAGQTFGDLDNGVLRAGPGLVRELGDNVDDGPHFPVNQQSASVRMACDTAWRYAPAPAALPSAAICEFRV